MSTVLLLLLGVVLAALFFTLGVLASEWWLIGAPFAGAPIGFAAARTVKW